MAIWVRPCGWHQHWPDVDAAPFYADLADGPDDVTCVWRNASDGVRLRLAFWPGSGAKGTVFLFPGRTEHIEKYGRIASELNAAGFALMTIDWRGQGLSGRLSDDPNVGHVARFLDFQLDVNAMTGLAHEAGLPKPWFLIAHSMGGCLGLRSLINGLEVERAVFSAPMWGIELPVPMRPLPYILPPVARALRIEESLAPGTSPSNYTSVTAFNENVLTSDPETYAWLKKHADATSDFALGGPSVQWVGEATTEFDAIAGLPRPSLPVRTYLGTQESIVSADAIHRMHAHWPSGELRVIKGAKHEIMMEAAHLRRKFIDETLDFFGQGSA